MADNVVKFYSANAAENPDNVLEQAIGVYDQVLVIGWTHEGQLSSRSSLNLAGAGDLLWLIECFKHAMMNGVFSGD